LVKVGEIDANYLFTILLHQDWIGEPL